MFGDIDKSADMGTQLARMYFDGSGFVGNVRAAARKEIRRHRMYKHFSDLGEELHGFFEDDEVGHDAFEGYDNWIANEFGENIKLKRMADLEESRKNEERAGVGDPFAELFTEIPENMP